MAAEGVVSLTVERLGELLISEAKLLYGVRDEIIKVQRQMRNIRGFLKEADKKQIRDERVREWVVQMRELAFRLEDVIETFAMEILIKNQKSSFKDILKRFFCILSEGVSRHNIAMEIDSINADIAELAAKLPTYGITKGLEEGESSEVDLKFYSHNVEKDFIGMEKEMEQVISRLKNTQSGCEVVSIYGMGGQGKTTLAQKLYNHPEVKNHFKALAWVCISQQFDREKVLTEVLKQLLPPDRKKEVSNMDDAELVRELYEIQQEKSCLIVIDDIWKISSWEKLKHAFPVGVTTTGSKILFTTRDQSVAEIGFPHKIPHLTEEQGWQLLSKKAQVNDISEKHMISEMERIGRNLVNRCEGLPLAIASLGGILKGKLLREWELINKDISFYLAKGKGITNGDKYYSVMHVLGLSYECLPPHLKHCFLYFANYMEDEKIRTDKLYMLWVAEGLVLAEDKADGETMLDVAERYLDELAHRSLVQVETYKFEGASWSKYMSCRVHDLIRDLCLSKAKEEKFIDVIHLKHKPEDEFRASMVRRLCIRFIDEQVESMLNCYDQHVISHIRSLYVWKEYSGTEVVPQWPDRILSLKKFRLLRVLTVSNYKFTVQNMSRISELTCLKYLSLFGCELGELPESIGNLRNLVYFDIRVSDVIRIPNVLWKLKQLKYLYLPRRIEKGSRTGKLRLEGLNELEMLRNYYTMYCDANELIQLSKLTVLDAGLEADNNLIWNIIKFLKSRDMRHSDLTIVGDAESLSCLPSLLECSINTLSIYARISILPKEYDHTRFSAHLSMLTLEDCRMEEDSMILLEKLPGLRTLHMQTNAYLGVEMVCSSGGFPQLTELLLYALPWLSKWRLDEGAMPNLCRLCICQCKELEMLPNGLTFLIALEQLDVRCMPSTFTDRIQVIDDIEGEDYYKVRHISHISTVNGMLGLVGYNEFEGSEFEFYSL